MHTNRLSDIHLCGLLLGGGRLRGSV